MKNAEREIIEKIFLSFHCFHHKNIYNETVNI